MKRSLLCFMMSALLCSCTVATAEQREVDLSALSNQKLGWGQGIHCNEKNQPLSCLEYNRKYGEHAAVFLNEGNGIALTFDEGYENGYTASILDTLKEKKVKAVFFVTYDYVHRNPELVERMIREGHVVGNHTWSHPSMPDKSAQDAVSEITKLHDYVQSHFQYTMTLFRPPMGEFSERTLEIAKRQGYKSIFWSFAYKDYDVNAQPEPAKAMERIVSAAHPGAIYLLHAVSETNSAILGDVIDALRQQGYSFILLT